MTLAKGDACYFDSSMGHALVNAGEGDARVPWVCFSLRTDPEVKPVPTKPRKKNG